MKGETKAAQAPISVEAVLVATEARLIQGPVADRALGGVSIDSRTLGPDALFVAIQGPRFDGHDFVAEAAAKGAAAVLVDKPCPAPPGLAVLEVDDTTKALGRLARHLREAAELPVVGITGSTGKTTTKEMAAAFLGVKGPVLKTEGNLNNQWGLPLTLARLNPTHRAAVLELGMSSPGELRKLTAIARPNLAVITNVAPVHLEFFESVDAIAQAKAEVLEGLPADGVAVLNGDDQLVRRIGESFGGEIVWFGHDRRYDVSAERWRGTVHGMRFELRMGGRAVEVALGLAGRHFVSDFLAAAAASHHFGVEPEQVAEVAASLEPAPHRGQVLRLGEGVTLLDDAYNASPAAVEAAVAALDMAPQGRRVAFLGDMLELGQQGPELHRRTGERVASSLDALFAVGPLAAGFLEGAQRAGFEESSLGAFLDSEAAARAAASRVQPGDAVLVKGSRGIHMEAIVESLLGRFGLREAGSEKP